MTPLARPASAAIQILRLQGAHMSHHAHGRDPHGRRDAAIVQDLILRTAAMTGVYRLFVSELIHIRKDSQVMDLVATAAEHRA
jgi:hypothetical protein